MIYAKYKDKICPDCHSEMRLKEIKVKCEGSQDEIYECRFCGCEKRIKVRYEQIVSTKKVDKIG